MAGILARAKARRAVKSALRSCDAARGLRLEECLKTSATTIVYAGALGATPVVVKRSLGPDAADLTQAQADELGFQHPRMSDGLFRVPEPLISRPETGVVVMGRAPGLRLDHAVRAAPERRLELVAAAGRWLAHYIAPRTEVDAFGGGYWIKRRTAAMDRLPEGGDRSRIEGLIAIMRAERAEIAGRVVTRARSHGDFCALNLMVSGEQIWGVDIHNTHWIAVGKDLARFLVWLEITQPAGVYDGPCGLSMDDCDALVSQEGLLPPGEAEMILPYFLASELAGRLISERGNPYVLSAAQVLADRMIAGRG